MQVSRTTALWPAAAIVNFCLDMVIDTFFQNYVYSSCMQSRAPHSTQLIYSINATEVQVHARFSMASPAVFLSTTNAS
eukprot:COSAG05_NODE_130_length_17165_cov_154.623638_24_plen_78_part_00